MNETEKLNQFLASVEQRAYRLAEMAVSDREEALDLVQEAMTKLVAKYRHKSSTEWRPLFYRILQSCIRDWYRRQTVKRRIFIWSRAEKAGESNVDPVQQAEELISGDPAVKMETDGFAPALEIALKNLSLRQRQVFLLRVWEGLNVKQTAEAMSCSEGSVKSHYFRALQALKLALADFR